MLKTERSEHRVQHAPRPPLTPLLFLFLYAVVIAASVYEFHKSLPKWGIATLQENLYVLEDLANRWGVRDVLTVGAIWLACYLLGRKFLQMLHFSAACGMEYGWLCTTLGLSLLSLITFLMSVGGLLHHGDAYAVLAAPVVIWCKDVRRMFINAVRSRPLGRWPPGSLQAWSHFLLTVFILAVLGFVFLAALGPEFEYDAVAIHLAAAKTFVQHHRLVSIPDIPHTFFPKNITLLFAFGMLLHSDITAKVLNYSFGILAFLGAYILGVRLYSRAAGLIAAAVLASSPLFLWTMKTAHLDCGSALFVFLSLYTVLLWLEEDGRGCFALAVYSTAFSLGTRYQALFALGALSVVVLWRSGFLRGMFRSSFRRAALFFFVSLAGMAPWALANAIQTKNPLFPFFNGIFHSPYWNPQLTQIAVAQQASSGVPVTLANWWAVLTNLWAVSMDRPDFHGNIGVFYLLLVPLLIFRRRIEPALKSILVFALVYWLFWTFTGQHARYLLSILPGLAVAGGIALADWLKLIRDRLHMGLSVAAAVLLGCFAILNSPFFEIYGSSARYGVAISDSVPWQYLSGAETRDEFLTRHLREYGVVQRLNQLPGGKRVLFWWNATPPALYLQGTSAYVFSPFFHQLDTNDPEELHRVLLQNRMNYVVTDQRNSGLGLLSDPEREFVQRYLKKIYESNAINLYEVASTPLQQDVVSYDFLNHLAAAAIHMPRRTPQKQNADYGGILQIAGDSRYALLTRPPAEVSFTLTVPQANPVLQFSIGRVWRPCLDQGSFKIWVSTLNGGRHLLFNQDLRAQNYLQELGWFGQQVDLQAYAGEKATLTFETSRSGKGCDWSLWADPQIISGPSAVYAKSAQ